MNSAAYAVGIVVMLLIVAPVAFGAVRLRARFFPDWAGAPARMVEIVLGLAMLLFVGEVLGSVGAFSELPLVLGSLSLGGAAAYLGRPNREVALPSTGDTAQPEAGHPGPIGWGVTILATALVIGEWSTRVIATLRTGTYDIDSLRYHLPNAARFMQEGWVTRLHFTELDLLGAFAPANSELLHGFGMVAFHRDLLSPFLNLGWLALALLAGWCIGRPAKLGPATLTVTALVLSTPVLSVTQPGAGTNDVAAIALLLASIAFLVNGHKHRAPIVLAGLAAGLSVGTKVTVAGSVVVLAAIVLVVVPRGARRTAFAGWLTAVIVGGGFWYLRNLIRVGNPLPSVHVAVGPVSLPSPHDPVLRQTGFSVAHYIANGHFWRSVVPHGLSEALGPAWPVIFVLAAAGAVAAAVRGPTRLVRMLGIMGIVAGVAYLFTPYSAGGPSGNPHLFAADLRFLDPALAVGLVSLTWVYRDSRYRTRVLGLLVAALLVTQLAQAGPYTAWAPGHRLEGLGVAVLVMAGGTLWLLRRRLAAGGPLFWLMPVRLMLGYQSGVHAFSPRSRRSTGKVLAGALLLAVALVIGNRVQHDYLQHRYTTGPLATPIDAWAQGVHNQRIGVVGFPLQYPLLSSDLSNRVQYVGQPGSDGNFFPMTSCRGWRAAVAGGRYNYVVLGPQKVAPPGTPEVAWTSTSSSAQLVLRDRGVSVYRLDGRLDPEGCP